MRTGEERMDRIQTGYEGALHSLLTRVEARSDALQQARASAAAYGAAHGFQNTDIIDGALQALSHVAADMEARLAGEGITREIADQ
jgi:hypothetical protein